MKPLAYKQIKELNSDTYLSNTEHPLVQYDDMCEDYEIHFDDGSFLQIMGPNRKRLADTIASLMEKFYEDSGAVSNTDESSGKS